MNTYQIKTKAMMEQTYIIEAMSEEDANVVALANLGEITEQTLVGEAELIKTTQVA